MDIKKIREERAEDMRWFFKGMKLRSVGAYKMANDFSRADITDGYDYLIFVRNSTSSALFD